MFFERSWDDKSLSVEAMIIFPGTVWHDQIGECYRYTVHTLCTRWSLWPRLTLSNIIYSQDTVPAFQPGVPDSISCGIRNFNFYPGTRCISFSVFCPVLPLAMDLILYWPHIQGGQPLCIFLFFWPIVFCPSFRNLTHRQLDSKCQMVSYMGYVNNRGRKILVFCAPWIKIEATRCRSMQECFQGVREVCGDTWWYGTQSFFMTIQGIIPLLLSRTSCAAENGGLWNIHRTHTIWVHAITISSPKWKNHCEEPGTTQEINISVLEGGQYGSSTKMGALMVYDFLQTFGKKW